MKRLIKIVLWDFGDTLADETWMLAPLDGVHDWPRLYRGILNGGELAQRWNLGDITAADVAEALAAELGAAPGRILAHMRACSRKVRFFPRMMAFTEACPLPQAIVTVNPDIFSDVVVPTYGLDSRFAAIITSWEQRRIDKPALCDAAIARIDPSLSRAECLLVDNREDNVLAWRAHGGPAFHFRGESAFHRDIGGTVDWA